MGLDMEAIAVLGFEATVDEFRTEERGPGCDHKHAANFCPECGKPAVVEDEGWIDGIEDEFDGEYRGLEIVIPDTAGEERVVGICLGNTQSSIREDLIERCQRPDARCEEKIMAALKGTPFEGREIALYCVLRISC